MSEPAFKTMSLEEYLRTELESSVKREYVGGFVYPIHGQAGTSDEHDTIVVNLLLTVGPLAKRVGCFMYTADMRVRSADGSGYYYPDLTVTCEPRVAGTHFKVAPCLLIEVLSKSTAHTDRGNKYHAYTSLPSLQTYLIAEQTERRVYAYSREGGEWVLTEYVGQGEIPLPYLNTVITLDEIYDGVLPSQS
ncbi:Uma2 family endonuclease [Deinococcus marmoris]|uniref:Putative restriction endonuclease domain-containing protein n=1 Tax=Deinococcus marmoris TaxID=249408 RepID=A0A1U7NRX2_9DEIO|nr:Uma2 family endonuclease [Deinococcus marmoris]OLV15669.1 hypothetical protein BOO71_0014212 [Deinococcus marmoris]